MARSSSSLLLKGVAGLPAACSLGTAVAGSFYHHATYSTNVTDDPDTHEDFRPTSKLVCSDLSKEAIVEQEVKENPVMIYMKACNVPFSARNILEDPELKNAVKAFSNWPTFPQIFIKGEFIGGSDIILNMHETGELKEKLKDINANQGSKE